MKLVAAVARVAEWDISFTAGTPAFPAPAGGHNANPSPVDSSFYHFVDLQNPGARLRPRAPGRTRIRTRVRCGWYQLCRRIGALALTGTLRPAARRGWELLVRAHWHSLVAKRS